MSEQLQVGDKVNVVRRGAIGWELEDYTGEDFANLKDDKEYEVSESDYDGDAPSVKIKGVRPSYIHPDHFKKV